MDPKQKTISTKEKATVEWVLCSTHFDDIVFIAPEGLNKISITSQYQGTDQKGGILKLNTLKCIT